MTTADTALVDGHGNALVGLGASLVCQGLIPIPLTVLLSDLDKGGLNWQRGKVYLGPSLGWVMEQVRPTLTITSAGTFTVLPGSSVILVNAAGLVTINLPDVAKWIPETAYQPATGFERSIWIKDSGGNANSFNITVVPFGTQTIDLLAQSLIIAQNRMLLRLYPLNDLSGWFSG